MGFCWRVISNPEARRPLKRIARKFNQMTVTLTSRKGTGRIRNDSRVNLKDKQTLKRRTGVASGNIRFWNRRKDTPKP
jgi:hypothetical protein